MDTRRIEDEIINANCQIPDDRFLGNPVADAIQRAESLLAANNSAWDYEPMTAPMSQDQFMAEFMSQREDSALSKMGIPRRFMESDGRFS